MRAARPVEPPSATGPPAVDLADDRRLEGLAAPPEGARAADDPAGHDPRCDVDGNHARIISPSASRGQAPAASHAPLRSDRNSASITRMFATASSTPNGSAISPRTARENASP